MSETHVQRTISKSRTLFTLLLVEPNTSEEVTLFHPFVQLPLNEFRNEIFYDVKPLDDHCLPLEYKPTLSFDISFDEHIETFNKLMRVRSYAFNWFENKGLQSELLYVQERWCT